MDGAGASAVSEADALPLAGVVVLDFSTFLAGPSCALRLADLGAQVIKVERPDGGDLCRSLRLQEQTLEGDSALFHTINRNKQSFTADLKSPDDLRRVRALIGRADVMIHNFRPGVMDRLGLDYAAVAAINPRIVYGVVSGYGEEGPWSGKPGQDLLVQSLSGIAWLSGDADQAPTPAGLSIVDMAAGAHLAQGVLSLLVRRGVTGRGGKTEVSLMESALDLQFEGFTAFLNGDGRRPERSGVSNANAFLGAPYGIYRTRDGWMAVAMTAVDRLGALVGCEGLAADHDPASWQANRDAHKAELAKRLAEAPTAHWLAILEPAGVWCAPVLDWLGLMEQDGFRALDAVQKIRTRNGTSMRTTRCPIRIDGKVLTSTRAAPPLGADTDTVAQALRLDEETQSL
jgi:crotonobetainyl-CoA:carnitine CoA-transferase CaiB-like acyl-CoA transferase